MAEALQLEVSRFVAATEAVGVQRLARTAAIFGDPAHDESLRCFRGYTGAVGGAWRYFGVAHRRYAVSAASGRNPVCCHELLLAYGHLLVAVGDTLTRRGADPPITDRELTRTTLRALRLLEATAPPGLEQGCPPPPHPASCACGYH